MKKRIRILLLCLWSALLLGAIFVGVSAEEPNARLTLREAPSGSAVLEVVCADAQDSGGYMLYVLAGQGRPSAQNLVYVNLTAAGADGVRATVPLKRLRDGVEYHVYLAGAGRTAWTPLGSFCYREPSRIPTTIMLAGAETLRVPTKGNTTQSGALTARVLDQFGEEMEAQLEWSVPQTAGVTLDASHRLILTPEAAGGTLRVTAKAGAAVGHLDVQIERDAAQPAQLRILCGETACGTELLLPIPGSGSARTQFAAEAEDQYGAPWNGEIRWTLDGSAMESGCVEVSAAQEENSTMTLRAEAGAISCAVTLRCKGPEIEWPTVQCIESPHYGQKWSEMLTLSGGSASLCGAALAGSFTIEDGTPAAGKQRGVICFCSEDGAYVRETQTGEISIARAKLKLTAGSATIAYGEALPEIGVTAAGLVGHDTLDTAQLTVTTAYQPYAPVGSYALSVGSLPQLANYEIETAAGTLTVTEKKLEAPRFAEIAAQTYSGSAICPPVRLYDGEREIPETEYTVAYCDNQNAGTAKISIIDRAGGNYILSGETSFAILRRDVSGTRETEQQSIVQGDGAFAEPDFVWAGTLTYAYAGETMTAEALRARLAALPKGERGEIAWRFEAGGNDCGTVTGKIAFTVIAPAFTVNGAPATAENAAQIAETPVYGMDWVEIVTIAQIEVQLGETRGEGEYYLDRSGCPHAGSADFRILFRGSVGGRSYEALEVTAGTVQILPREVALRWSGTTLPYNGSAQAPAAALTGVLPGDECGVLIRGAQTDAGSYTAAATLTNPDYCLPQAAETPFRITKAALTVTAQSAACSYRDAFSGAAEYAGFVPGEDASVLEGSLTLATDYTAGSPVGTYPVTPGGVTAKNYEITFVPGNLRVAPRVVTPTFSGLEAAYPYTGAEICPSFRLFDGETEIPASEYRTEYRSNTNAGRAAILVTDCAGNYMVNASAEFRITPREVGETREPETQDIRHGTGRFSAPQLGGMQGRLTYFYEDAERTEQALSALLAALPDGAAGSIAWRFEASGNNTGVITGEIRFRIVGLHFCVGDDAASVENALLVKQDAVYGDSWDEIVRIRPELYAAAGGSPGEGSFSLRAADAPTAGTHSYEIFFTGEAGGVRYENALVLRGSVEIAPRTLGVRWENTALRYNGSTQSPRAILTGLLPGDSCEVSITGGTRNAGSFTATAVSPTNANYILPEQSSTAYTVAKLPLAVRGLSAVDRCAESENCEVALRGGTLDGLLPGDEVSLALGSGRISSPEAGADRAVDLRAALVLAGADAGNYTLQPPAVTVNILPPNTEIEVAAEAGAACDEGALRAAAVQVLIAGADAETETKAVVSLRTKDARTEETGGEVTAFSAEITPVCRLYRSGECYAEKELQITKPVRMQIAVPQQMQQGAAYVSHLDYEYPATIENGTAIFDNPHGFSRFRVTTQPQAALEVDGVRRLDAARAASQLQDGAQVRLLRADLPQIPLGSAVTFTLDCGGYADPFVAAEGYEITREGATRRVAKKREAPPAGGGGSSGGGGGAAPEAEAPETPAPFANPFEDVHPGEYWYEAVLWAAEHGITAGKRENLFAPQESCTRAEMVTFLWRAAGCPTSDAALPFRDAAENAYYTQAVRWAAEMGITDGKAPGIFDPNGILTRAEALTLLYRAAGSPAAETEAQFADVCAGDYCYAAVCWAAGTGITNGRTKTAFAPGEMCGRGEIVTFLFRASAR